MAGLVPNQRPVIAPPRHAETSPPAKVAVSSDRPTTSRLTSATPRLAPSASSDGCGNQRNNRGVRPNDRGGDTLPPPYCGRGTCRGLKAGTRLESIVRGNGGVGGDREGARRRTSYPRAYNERNQMLLSAGFGSAPTAAPVTLVSWRVARVRRCRRSRFAMPPRSDVVTTSPASSHAASYRFAPSGGSTIDSSRVTRSTV